MKKAIIDHLGKWIVSSLVILLPWALGWQTAWEGVGLLAAHWICLLLVLADRRNRENQSKKALGLIFWLIPVLSLLLGGLGMALRQGIATGGTVSLVTGFAFGLLFLLVGNYMPKMRQNRTMGIRVKWTLASEENWNATHRFAGKLWVAAGLVSMISALLPMEWMMVCFIAAILLAAVVPCVYSWRYYKKQLQEGTVGQTHATPAQKAASALITLGVVAFVAWVMVAGSLKVVFGSDSFTVKAGGWQDLTVSYDAIESVEYVEGDAMPSGGIRTYGMGNLRFLMGTFTNDVYGTYTRYTCRSCEDCIVLQVSGQTVVINGPDAGATRQMYQDLTARLEASAAAD